MGTLKTGSGLAIAHAKVVAIVSGQAVASVATDDHGRFEFPPLAPNVYRVEIGHGESWVATSKIVVVKGGEKSDLTLIGHPAGESTSSQPNPLGPVSFYTDSRFQQGQLTNPSGGGGYSNAASAQAVQMLKQYLATAKPENSAGAPTNAGTPDDSADARGSDLERTGSTLLAQRDYAQAVQVFQRGVAADPRSERLQMGLGFALYGASKYAEATEALSEAARLAPDDPAPIVMLAEVLQFEPDQNAVTVVRQFAERHPESAHGHYAYGLSLWEGFRSRHETELLERAQAEFEKAVVLDPNDAVSHLQLGMIFDERKLTLRAVLEYQSAIRLDPALAVAHYRLAQDYQRLGKKEEAATEFAEYEKLRNSGSQ
ncbi:MAG TPA: tetratricopeptide repeat protein [Terriglobia bacterium]|nr:tetratricopeptide repeat protein [Terriglobia bacterium]